MKDLTRGWQSFDEKQVTVTNGTVIRNSRTIYETSLRSRKPRHQRMILYRVLCFMLEKSYLGFQLRRW